MMWKLVEPQWGVNVLMKLFAWMQASVFWSHWIPILADVFVFTYPVYLLLLYGYGIVKMLKCGNVEGLKNGLYHKVAAMYIFVGVVASVLMNIIIQFFVDKVRPHALLGLLDLKKETVLHKFLPSASFPSDHAAVSMAIAMMSLFRGIKNKDKTFMRFGGMLLVFSFITSFARVTSGVHWPTDVIAGSLVGIVIPLVLMWKPVYRFGTKMVRYLAIV